MPMCATPWSSSAFLIANVAKFAAKHLVGEVSRPAGWRGWRIAPLRIEFWHDSPFRLHDRIEFRRDAPDQPWSKTRLYP